MATHLTTTVTADTDDALVVGPVRLSVDETADARRDSPTRRCAPRSSSFPKWTHYVARRRTRARASRRDRAAACAAVGRVRRADLGRRVVERRARGRDRTGARRRPRSSRSGSRRCARRRRTTWSGRPAGSWTRSWSRSVVPVRCCRSSAGRRRSTHWWRCPPGSRWSVCPPAPSTTSAVRPTGAARAAAFMGKRIVEDAIGARHVGVGQRAPDRRGRPTSPTRSTARRSSSAGTRPTTPLTASTPTRATRCGRRRRSAIEEHRRSGALLDALDRRRARCGEPDHGRQPRRLRRDGPRPPGRHRDGRDSCLARPGVHGARSSGGGAGGTVVVVCERGALDDVDALVR